MAPGIATMNHEREDLSPEMTFNRYGRLSESTATVSFHAALGCGVPPGSSTIVHLAHLVAHVGRLSHLREDFELFITQSQTTRNHWDGSDNTPALDTPWFGLGNISHNEGGSTEAKCED